MEGKLESVLITYSFVIIVGKSNSDGHRKLVFKWLGRREVVPIDASLLVEICKVIYLGKIS